jgi:hypothetical protein
MGGSVGGSYRQIKSSGKRRMGGGLTLRGNSRQRLYTAKGSLAFAGCYWAGEHIEGPALQGRKGFFSIWLTPPGYRIEPLSDRNSRAGYRIHAESVASYT